MSRGYSGVFIFQFTSTSVFHPWPCCSCICRNFFFLEFWLIQKIYLFLHPLAKVSFHWRQKCILQIFWLCGPPGLLVCVPHVFNLKFLKGPSVFLRVWTFWTASLCSTTTKSDFLDLYLDSFKRLNLFSSRISISLTSLIFDGFFRFWFCMWFKRRLLRWPFALFMPDFSQVLVIMLPSSFLLSYDCSCSLFLFMNSGIVWGGP